MTVRELRQLLFELENQDAKVVWTGPQLISSIHVETDPEGIVYISRGDVDYLEL